MATKTKPKKSKEQLEHELSDELRRLDKERSALLHHKPHSLRHHQAKLRLMRLHGEYEATKRALAHLIAKQHQGKGEAVSWALSQNGVTEHPYGSNWGHPVEDYIEYTGFSGPEFWCGCFVCVAVVREGKAKIETRIRLAAGSYIIEDARNHHNGLHAVPFDQATKGDILVYWGGEHIGLCRGRPVSGIIPTVEGNTSPATAGSQYNGGCVAAKTRRQSDVTIVARPNY